MLSGSLATQTMYLDGQAVGTVAGEIAHSAMEFNQLGAAYSTDPWPSFTAGTAQHFKGEIDEVAFYEHALGESAVKAHLAARVKAESVSKITLPSGRTAATVSYDVVNDRLREYVDQNGGVWKLAQPAVTGSVENVIRSSQYVDPGNRYHFFDFDPKLGRLLRAAEPLGMGVRPEDVETPGGEPTVPPTCPPGEFCGGPPPGGSPWEGGPTKGQGVRTYDYDSHGFPSVITNENGFQTFLTSDDRGNTLSRKTCRVAPTNCQTTYATYYFNPDNLIDPRNDKVLSTSDARSSGPTDTKYRTTYTYTDTGQKGLLWTQRLPDGSTTTHTYTQAGSPSPAGLVETTTDGRNAQTRYFYYATGDLEKVRAPSGLTTSFTYDKLGRKKTQTEVSDAYPNGLTTTYTYDELSRQKTVTSPPTTNAVTGVKHTLQQVYEYDADGNIAATEVRDLTGGDLTRRATVELDEHGLAKRVVDAEGNETTYGYDGFGNQVWSVDAVGNKREIAYTARNAIAEVRLKAWHGKALSPGGSGREGNGDTTVKNTLVLQSYAYDLAGRLTRATDAMGRTKRFEYYQDDKVRRVTAIGVRDPFQPTTAPRNIVLEDNAYDAAGNLSRRVTPGGLVTEHTYDEVGRVKTTTADPQGLVRRTAFDYDLGGNVTKVTQSGNPSNSARIDRARSHVVEYGYDGPGRRTTETAFNGAERLTTTRTFDQRGVVRTITDPRGAGYTTDLAHDELRRLVSSTSPQVNAEVGGGTAVATRPVVQYGLDTFGGTVDVKDPNGNVSKTGFDKLGRTVRVESPEYKRPGAATGSRAVTLTEYDPLGNVRKVTDPRGAVIEYRYDQLNRMREMREPDPDNAGRTKGIWAYEYTHVGESLSVTGPTGVRTESTYDDLGRRVTSTQLERYPTPAAHVTKYTYDDASNLKTVKSPSDEVTSFDHDVLGQTTKQTDPAGVITQLGYDSAGRQARMSDGLGRTAFQAHDDAGRPSTLYTLDANEALLRSSSNRYDRAGNVISTTNPLTRETTYTYDALSRLITQTEPVADNHTITTSFGYDASGNRTRLTDGRTNKTIYTFNSLGLPETTLEPSTPDHPNAADRTWTTSYDLSGNPDLVSAPGGVTRTRAFDLMGRLRTETGAGAEEATESRTIGYDDAGRMQTVSAPGGTNVYTYNDRGGLLTTTGPSGVSSFGYDANGRLNERTDESGTARQAYVQGRLATLQDGITGLTATVGYNDAGQVKSLDYGSGRARAFGYDEFGRLKTDTVTKNDVAAASITYSYDTADRLKTKTTAGLAGAGTNTYDYDYANRLKSWTFNGTTTAYDWDDAGNRTRAGTKTASYDARNRLKSDGDYTYKWSARGTMAARVSSGLEEKYGFDAFDRAVMRDGTRYAYDGLDRVSARNGKKFSYAGQSLDLVSDGDAKFSRDAGGSLLALSQGTDKRVAMNDAHGDLVGGFDTQAVPDSASFDPFGQSLASSGSRRSLGFQGDYTDPSTGDVDMGARWYSPRTGGFTARDNIGLPVSPSGMSNRYGYAAGAPTNFSDQDGHRPSRNCTWIKDPGFGPRIRYCPSPGDYPDDGECLCPHPVTNLITDLWSKHQSAFDWLSGLWDNMPGDNGSGDWNNPNAKGWYWDAASVTAAAREEAADVARTNPLPNVPAATNPLFSGSAGDSMSPPVSSTPNAPAGQVGDHQFADQVPGLQKEIDAVTNGNPVIQTVTVPGTPETAGQNGWKELGHFLLDVIGMIPVIGEIADGINAVWYLAEGDYVNAALSAAGMVPFAGAAATGLKLLGKASDGLGLAGKATTKLGPDALDVAVGCVRRNSFVGDTPVVMADGSTKPIQDVREDDEVLATDPTTGETGPRKVEEVVPGEGDKALVAVTLDVDGATGHRRHRDGDRRAQVLGRRPGTLAAGEGP